MFFDSLKLPGPLELQAEEFLNNSRSDVQWYEDRLIPFLDSHKDRVRCKELASGTLKNYYRAAKLFFQSNHIQNHAKNIELYHLHFNAITFIFQRKMKSGLAMINIPM